MLIYSVQVVDVKNKSTNWMLYVGIILFVCLFLSLDYAV